MPRETGVDRPTVVINMLRLTHIMPINHGERMVCLAGAGIHSVLQKAAELGRESHSVLGSIFLNPTVAAGIAFGSGGTQLRKGPVYTERLLYARVDANGKVQLVNSLGINAGSEDELFAKLESGVLREADVDSKCALAASQITYGASVCACHGSNGAEVSRFNASTEARREPVRGQGAHPGLCARHLCQARCGEHTVDFRRRLCHGPAPQTRGLPCRRCQGPPNELRIHGPG